MEDYVRGDYAAAVPGLQRAADIAPDSARILFFLGASYLLDGRTAPARESLRRVVSLGDTVYLEEARFLVAQSWLIDGDSRSAEFELRELIEMNGDLADDARRLLDRVTAVKAAPAN
jgi:Flp pilus assembly protein TadD